ncbi:hypothetical protein LTR37_014257 [Vermiconidia calcicola]|uniref:Uncharacterized protein n=1 Tax=Vermiconidia calcicola TaxID=1690605 RepID=A0ACC3MX18_9PEZI|nr:hypothetical protein LTR37_014257 [Vermiconidia calcicola]
MTLPKHDESEAESESRSADFGFLQQTSRLRKKRERGREARKMLLVHQAGSVKVGEVVRYTLTYTPANDRILPTPSNLHVKVKNTSALPLRAAWVHGPYTLSVAAYPAVFNPYSPTEAPERDGTPQYEPMLKASGSWQAKLLVPDDIRETGADLGKRRQSTQSGEPDGSGSVTWIIEVASQILFSNSASVNFEVLVGRDERSLDLGFAAVAGQGHGGPGQVQQHHTEKDRRRAWQRGHVQTAGVYSKAVRLVVEDTEVLWDKPPLPSKEDEDNKQGKDAESKAQSENQAGKDKKPRKRKKIHLVVVTHGMHSNTGTDMLFLKESIDATVKQARVDAKKRKESYRAKGKEQKQSSDAEGAHAEQEDDADTKGETSTAPLSGGQEDIEDTAYDSDDDEETIVRGFQGNAVRTENGIQYLGKRLAKYILRFTYPDQPFLPVKKAFTRTLTDTFKTQDTKAKRDGIPSHGGSSVHNPESSKAAEDLPYTFTSISFVGHSLGGLIQTYAVAYIHKHNPHFFTQIKPVNFICMASPMLGLSNENPMYVKFALDFGLVGRTGQDLGLTWRAPTLARGGWNAMIGGLGASQKDQENKDEDPAAKPLLRILPTGPAHQVLRMFRNRTMYSNVVNDGIVPLRTSCLLFLDWRGLGKVDKARRENGLIGTVAEWGWAELTGQNQSSQPERAPVGRAVADEESDDEHVRQGEGETVPQPAEDETIVDNKRLTARASYDEETASQNGDPSNVPQKRPQQQDVGIWDNFLNFFKPNTAERSVSPKPKTKKPSKALSRGQTIYQDSAELPEDVARGREGTTKNPTMRPHLHGSEAGHGRPMATRGDSMINNETGHLEAPPKTSIFESAGDILHPPLPSKQWINDPTSRTRTIFHDRVYHPEDIPPPPMKRQGSRFGLSRVNSSDAGVKSGQSSTLSANSQDSVDFSGMRVEEKIARAYHRDLSWRKVLVRLEPDAHNNIIVRRMFANAYGWPVIKHLCDTHFANTHAAMTRDEHEPARERAKPMDAPLPESGEEVREQTDRSVPERTMSETREATDELASLNAVRDGASSTFSSHRPPPLLRQSSGVWDDSYFEGSDEDESDVDERNLVSRMLNPMAPKKPEPAYQPASPTSMKSKGSPRPSPPTSPRTPTAPYTDGHRGLAPTSPTTHSRSKSGASAKSTFDNSGSTEPVVSSKLVEEPETLGNTAEVGLRKTVEEQVSPPSKSKSASKPGSRGAAARTSSLG